MVIQKVVAIDKFYEELKKKKESRINESISKTGYETVPETEIERKKEMFCNG